MISSSPERRDEPDPDLVAKPHVPDLAPPSHFSASDCSLELSLAAAGRCLQEWWFESRAEVVAFTASKAAWEGERSLPSDLFPPPAQGGWFGHGIWGFLL